MLTRVRSFETAARAAALLVGLAVLSLYALFVFTNPYSGSDLAQDSVFLMTLVAALAGLEIWAVWNRLPILVIVAFIFSFVPVGMYMLSTPYWGVGVAHLSYLVIALLSWLDRREYRRVNQKAAVDAAALNAEVTES